MCSQMDAPDQYDAPEPVRPRTYRLSGDAPQSATICGRCTHPMHWRECGADIGLSLVRCGCRNDESRIEPSPLGRGSVALAVIGEMLTELDAPHTLLAPVKRWVLREARDRIAAAESQR